MEIESRADVVEARDGEKYAQALDGSETQCACVTYYSLYGMNECNRIESIYDEKKRYPQRGDYYYYFGDVNGIFIAAGHNTRIFYCLLTWVGMECVIYQSD